MITLCLQDPAATGGAAGAEQQIVGCLETPGVRDVPGVYLCDGP